MDPAHSQAARGHVGGDEDGGLRGGEAAEHGLARVLRQEHWLFPRAVAALCAGRVEWRDDSRPIVAELEEAKGEGDAL